MSRPNLMFSLILLCSVSFICEAQQAAVTAVRTSGTENNYTFHVTIQSPDTGCEQFADWWEVMSEDGKLIYRRILRHSHVDEQPFTRSGGAVKIARHQKVWIRAHMNKGGYGGKVLFGSVETGFKIQEIPAGLGQGLDKTEPLPTGCAF